MLPEFPKFKKLELSDQQEIEKITSKYLPYSDFNFVSMWSWDIKDQMMISLLNGNLVVKFTDYLTGHPFYSFLGENQSTETALTLLELSKQEGLDSELKLVPEVSVKGMDDKKLQIEEDRNNFDYIILISTLKGYDTKKTYSRKKAVNRLLKDFSPEVKLLDISDKKVQDQIFALINEKAVHDNKVIGNEFLAISKFIKGHKEISILPIGVYIGEDLVGFSFSEVFNNKYSTSHFWKAKTKVSQHIYSYLMQEKAKILSHHGAEYVNIEQDLGLDNLRRWKNSYGSEMFLKKYIVKLR